MKDTEKAVRKTLENPAVRHIVGKLIGATVLVKLAGDLEKEIKKSRKVKHGTGLQEGKENNVH